MNVKKSSNADLEGKKAAFFGLGFVISSALVLMAFTYKSIVFKPIAKKIEDDKNLFEEEIPEEILEMLQEEPPPPPPAAAPVPVVTDEVEEIPDDEKADDDPIELPPDPAEDPAEDPVEEPPAKIYEVSEVNPEYPGGESAMFNFINSKFEYPEMAREMGEQGTVYVQFVVFTDGSIKEVKVIKGVSKSIDREAKRVVRLMPKWKPGEQAGKPVNVRYILPIKATIQ